MSHPLRDKLISISVSDNEDLLERGYSTVHLNDVCLRLARDLLGKGASIAYGGVLGVGDLTKTLSDSARHELANHPSRVRDSKQGAPFINFQPWPFYFKITEEQQAHDLGTIKYRFVGDTDDAKEPSRDDKENAKRSARASSRMRRWMADAADARIVVGGKARGFKGLMPGVLEEALYHLEANKPLYIIGEFGGASHDLATAILRKREENPLPDSMIKEKRIGESAFDDFRDGYVAGGTAQIKYDVPRDEAEKVYERLQEQIHRVREKGLSNGLDKTQNEFLMTSESVAEIVGLISMGLVAVMGSGG